MESETKRSFVREAPISHTFLKNLYGQNEATRLFAMLCDRCPDKVKTKGSKSNVHSVKRYINLQDAIECMRDIYGDYPSRTRYRYLGYLLDIYNFWFAESLEKGKPI